MVNVEKSRLILVESYSLIPHLLLFQLPDYAIHLPTEVHYVLFKDPELMEWKSIPCYYADLLFGKWKENSFSF